ncbi:endonuclease NucS domain-containing protein [Pyxidicoccus sp. 3LG]
MTTEAAIRDHLAEHLTLIEPGLTLVRKEFKLPNPIGAKGFIDILARDRFGLTVVIELKRSDTASRSALHELHKYIALLRSHHGLGAESIRCIVASTHWHELRVPFLEFCGSVAYAAEGLQLHLDSAGVPVAVTRVEPLPPSDALSLCPDHMVFCFGDQERRTQGLRCLQQELERLRVRDHLILKLDHKHPSPLGPLPFALYVALGGVGFEARSSIEPHLSPSAQEVIEEMQGDEHGERWGFENAIFSDLAVAVLSEDTTMSAPDPFVGLLRDWTCTEIMRGGRFESRELHQDEELLSRLAGLDGDNPVGFWSIRTPRHKPSWDSARERLRYSLRESEPWLKGLHWFMRKAEEDSRSTLSILVFNPMNLLRVFRDLRLEGDPSVRPCLQAVLEPSAASGPSVLRGELVWDGATHPGNPMHILGEAFEVVFGSGDFRGYFAAAAMNQVWMLENELLVRHGLRYALVEYQPTVGGQFSSYELVQRGEQFEKRPVMESLWNLPRFLRANQSYLDAVVEFFSRYTRDWSRVSGER